MIYLKSKNRLKGGFLIYLIKPMLDRRKKYLQIAFNRSLEEIALMINSLPLSDRIIIEAGYPLIKNYGVRAISAIRAMWHERIFGIEDQVKNVARGSSFTLTGLGISFIGSLLKSAAKEAARKSARRDGSVKNIHFNPYIVADLKCMDRAFTEVEAAAKAGASAATCLGLAPFETIDEFIRMCEELRIDSMLDMMNVEYPFEVLTKLAKPPRIIMLHRGVDEREENRDKEIPFSEIEKILNLYDDVFIAVAGGETVRDVISGAFNGANILVVWKLFNEDPRKITEITNEFLEELK